MGVVCMVTPVWLRLVMYLVWHGYYFMVVCGLLVWFICGCFNVLVLMDCLHDLCMLVIVGVYWFTLGLFVVYCLLLIVLVVVCILYSLVIVCG